MSFEWPWLLLLLPLAALPFVAPAAAVLRHSSLALVARDRASAALQLALRLAGSIALAALLFALAGPYRPEYRVERIGKGAEIVVVLDRSRSMDENFSGPRRGPATGIMGNALDELTAGGKDSKGKVARQMLAEFAAKRTEDRFSMVVFSTLAMRVLDFTQKAEVIQAAIAAGNIGRGLAETDIGLALLGALDLFEDRPYSGSRLILLVSDGGDKMETDTRERIAYLLRKHRAALYWIYIRSSRSPSLTTEYKTIPPHAAAVPEYFLHQFFLTLATPYRAYEADNQQALQEAIDSVNRLENLPITTFDTVPRLDLSLWFQGTALGAVLLLLAAKLMEIRRWA